MSRFFIMLGAPGAGKGTQAKLLSAKLALPHISSGDIFRENIDRGTDLGKVADEYISRGELVPDDVTNAMIRERLSRADCSSGAVLDGFPRTTIQAEALDRMVEDLSGTVEVVIYIEVPEAVLIRRLSGRRMCRAHGHTYHMDFNPPRTPGVCDVDGSELYQREDDEAETVANRIRVYSRQTAPLVEYYREQGVLVEVDGEGDIDSVAESLVAAVPGLAGS